MEIVTGSRGFVGSKLLLLLSNLGREVIGIDDEYLNHEDWEVQLTDLLDNLNPSTIYHAGACSNTLESNVQLMMTRNYQSTKILSRWCRDNQKQLIYSSSAANFGNNERYPSNLYGWSKYVAEDYVVLNEGVALRYFNVYGPGEELKKNMASFLHQAYLLQKRGEEVKIFPGSPKRDFIYIDDVVAANIFASTHFRSLCGEYFEVGTGQPNTFEEVLRLAGISYSYLSDESVPPGYQFFTCANRTKWMPGWEPKSDLEKGVRDYLEHLRRYYS